MAPDSCSWLRTTRRCHAAMVALVFGLCVLSATARPVRVYEVDVKGAESPATLQEAMRQALVRATGRRESATDPALAAIVSGAQSFVKSYGPAPRGGTLVVFDGAQVERAIVAAGRGVWEDERPFTLVVLYPELPRAAQEAARIELEQAAVARGLPISLLPLSPVDASGNDIGRDGMMQMAQRYGGDAVLVGRSDSAGANGQWQWTLITNFTSGSWTGSLTAGIDGAVDNLAAPQGASLSQTESDVRLRIKGVASLNDYALVSRLLESMPGVRRSSVIEAEGNDIVFDILVRGGSETVSRSLSGADHLTRSDSSGTQLDYQYRP